MTVLAPGVRIAWRTEWLGYLPCARYHWVEVERAEGWETISRDFPGGWAMEDLLALEAAGLLRRTGESREPADAVHRITYEITGDR